MKRNNQPRTNFRVLLVDNDSTSLAIISKMLSDKGFQVSTSSTADETLSMAGKIFPYRFSLIVVDFHLPGMVGYEFLHKLAKIFLAPVAVISADKSDKWKLRQSWRKCCEVCLIKPIEAEQVEVLWKLAQRRKLPNRLRDNWPFHMISDNDDIDISEENEGLVVEVKKEIGDGEYEEEANTFVLDVSKRPRLTTSLHHIQTLDDVNQVATKSALHGLEMAPNTESSEASGENRVNNFDLENKGDIDAELMNNSIAQLIQKEEQKIMAPPEN